MIHVPRLLLDPDADWVAELEELPSNAGDADTLDLTPKKMGNVFNLRKRRGLSATSSTRSAARLRGVARKLDASVFNAEAATAESPAGLLSYALPASAAAAPDIAGIITAVAEIAAEGGQATAAYMKPADMGAVQVAAVTGGSLSDPTRPGVRQVGGAVFDPTPASPRDRHRGRSPLHRGGDPARRASRVQPGRRLDRGRRQRPRDDAARPGAVRPGRASA